MERFLPHLFLRQRIVSEIFFKTNEEDGDVWTSFIRFLDPLQASISLRRIHIVQRERALCFTLSKESGLSTENPIKIT